MFYRSRYLRILGIYWKSVPITHPILAVSHKYRFCESGVQERISGWLISAAQCLEPWLQTETSGGIWCLRWVGTSVIWKLFLWHNWLLCWDNMDVSSAKTVNSNISSSLHGTEISQSSQGSSERIHSKRKKWGFQKTEARAARLPFLSLRKHAASRAPSSTDVIEKSRPYQVQGKGAWVYHLTCASTLRCIRLFVTPWAGACQAPLSMGFSRQEYWGEWPFHSPGDPPNAGMEPTSLASLALAARFFTSRATGKPYHVMGVEKSHSRRPCVIADSSEAILGQTDPATGIMWHVGLLG